MVESRVLLTGASGFIAAHVLMAFLEKGYIVRFTVRSQEKSDQILQANEKYKHLLEPVIVPDIAVDGAYDEALRDNTLDGVIHTASPFTSNITNPHELLDPAIHGTQNLLSAIVKYAPKVRRVVITSSFAAIINPKEGSWPGHDYSEKDWNPVTMEEALTGDAITTYRGSKKFAEQAAWDFVKETKVNFDVVTLCPPMVYGPVINYQTLSNLNSSTERLYKYLRGDIKTIEPSGAPLWVDVRDLAQAHLAAFEKPEAGGNRFFIVADELYSNQDIADIFRKHFPELKDKVPEGNPGEGFAVEPGSFYTHNNSKSKEVLGLTYRSFETCAVDTANSLKNLLESD